MTRRNILVAVGTAVLLVGVAVVPRVMKESMTNDYVEGRARAAAKGAAEEAVLRKLIQGHWRREGEELVLLPDETVRNEVSMILADSTEDFTYSYRLSYFRMGNWMLDGEQLMQDVKQISDLNVTEIQIFVSTAFEGDRDALVEEFQRVLPRAIADDLRSKLEGNTFTVTVNMPSPDSLILTDDAESRAYSRVE